MTDLSRLFVIVAFVAVPASARAFDDPEIVELLRDAQSTHRDAWKRGQATLHLEITSDAKPGLATIDGDVWWDGANMILRFKVFDPEGIRFADRGRSLDTEWNFIARNAKRVVTYTARHDALNQRDATPNAFEPLYDLMVPTVFTRCCPPHGSQGLAWTAMIGPADSLPKHLQSSNFSHRTLDDGDIEQTRLDKSGNKVVTVFSAKENFAVRSSTQFDPRGSIGQVHEYSYKRNGDGLIAPFRVVSKVPLQTTKVTTTYRYEFSNVRLPGDVTPDLFSTESILTRIRQATDAGRRATAKAGPSVNDSTLNALSRSLRESGTARPSPR